MTLSLGDGEIRVLTCHMRHGHMMHHVMPPSMRQVGAGHAEADLHAYSSPTWLLACWAEAGAGACGGCLAAAGNNNPLSIGYSPSPKIWEAGAPASLYLAPLVELLHNFKHHPKHSWYLL